MADEDQTEEGKVGRDWVKGTDPKSSAEFMGDDGFRFRIALSARLDYRVDY